MEIQSITVDRGSTPTGSADDYLTPKQVTVEYPFTKPWLDMARHRKVGIPFYRIGRSIRYRRVDIEAFMNAGRVNVAPLEVTHGR